MFTDIIIIIIIIIIFGSSLPFHLHSKPKHITCSGILQNERRRGEKNGRAVFTQVAKSFKPRAGERPVVERRRREDHLVSRGVGGETVVENRATVTRENRETVQGEMVQSFESGNQERRLERGGGFAFDKETPRVREQVGGHCEKFRRKNG